MTPESQEVPPTANSSSSALDARSHQGSLRSKLVLSLAAIFLVFLLIDEVVRREVIEPEFSSLEKAGAIRDAKRVLAAFDSESHHIRELALQLAKGIPQGIATVRPGKQGAGKQGAGKQGAAHDTEGTFGSAVWIGYGAQEDTWTWIQTGSARSESAVTGARGELRRLLHHARQSPSQLTSGMTKVCNQSVLLFAVIALSQSAESHAESWKAAEGDKTFLVVGREIDDGMLQTISRQTLVEFSFEPADQTDANPKFILRHLDQSTSMLEFQLSGIQGEPLARISVKVPKEITARSARTTRLARNLFIVGSAAALAMLLVMLQKIVIGPLASIREHSQRVAEQGFSAEPMLMTRNDEIGQLATAFDETVKRLSDAQTQLARASQAAGRSQVASTVIHNVGNVLTNINSLLEAASAGINGLRIGPLEKLADRLRTDRDNELLLIATPDYLEGLAGTLKSDQETILQLLSTLHDNVRHIHDVIRDQQRHANPMLKSTRICLKDIIEEAIACCRAKLDSDMVSVEISGSVSSCVHSDRSLLLQILINIIGNARHAMRDNTDRARVLAVEITPGEDSIRLAFRDNGCGMTRETAQRVFDAHFTTRESGTGLGLHFCALTLKRLGGTIHAQSDGPGLGATFVLELPGDERLLPLVRSPIQPGSTTILATTP